MFYDRKIITSFLILLFLVSCGNRTRIKQGFDTGSLEEVEVQNLGFSEIFDSVLKENCLECHSQYSSYQVVRAQANGILDAVLTNRMPRDSRPLDSSLKAKLNSWVQNGAPEEAGDEEEILPLEPNFESLFVHVFAAKCLACHNPSPEARGSKLIDFTSYETLMASSEHYLESIGFPLFDEEFPDQSDILFVIGNEEEPMPPLDSNLPQVTDDELLTIQEWIAKGLPKK